MISLIKIFVIWVFYIICRITLYTRSVNYISAQQLESTDYSTILIDWIYIIWILFPIVCIGMTVYYIIKMKRGLYL